MQTMQGGEMEASCHCGTVRFRVKLTDGIQDGPPLHGIRRGNPSGPLLAGKQHKAAILARKVAKGPRKKRTRPKPRQYTVSDLERARDRVAAAERRIDNERLNIPHRGRAGLERAQRELSVIEAQLRLRSLLE